MHLTKGKRGDFSTLGAGRFSCTEMALRIVEPHIQRDVEVLPLLVDEGPYYLLNVTNVVDAFDEHRASFVRFPSGAVMEVQSYAFHNCRLLTCYLFKVPQFVRSETFCTDAFRSLILENKLTGLSFEQLT